MAGRQVAIASLGCYPFVLIEWKMVYWHLIDRRRNERFAVWRSLALVFQWGIIPGPSGGVSVKPVVSILALLALSACVTTPPPAIVSEFNGDSVHIVQTDYFGTLGQNPVADAEANRICAKGSKKRAEYASSRPLPTDQTEHLYLCL